MNTSYRAAAAAGAAFLALHLAFLPQSLEDVDSINFALGVRDFDVTRHQPHPPGYPVFILMAKAVDGAAPNEWTALALVSLIAGSLAAIALVAFFRALPAPPAAPAGGTSPASVDGVADVTAHAATLLVVTTPLFWVTAVRPLSDMAGLAAAVAVQAVAVRASTPQKLAIAAALAGLAAGIRSQVVWLTLPLLALQVLRTPGAARGAIYAVVAFGCGVLAWAVPLVALSGGLQPYLNALSSQGAEDFSGVVMLWTTPTPRQLVRAVEQSMLAPWGAATLAVVVLAWAVLGAGRMAIRPERRAALATLTAAFGPYFLFHLLFQETATTRYALPLVVAIGYLAVEGGRWLSDRAPVKVAVGLAVVNALVGTQALFWYAQRPAPAFRMLRDMRAMQDESTPPVRVLAMHRRAAFDLRRPFDWEGSRAPEFVHRLASPPKHEWLEVVRHWNGGGGPVWIAADPLRSDLELIGASEPSRYRWPFDASRLLGGVRPNEIDWYRVDPPRWYLAEGWALTPESAGVAREDGKGPGFAPIQARVQRIAGPARLMIGGRNFGAAAATFAVTLDGARISEHPAPPGFFLHFIDVEMPPGGPSYAELTVSASTRDVAIEQFDAGAKDRLMFGYAEGWHEREYNPVTGQLWRWASDNATLRVRGAPGPFAMTMAGEIEAADATRIVIRAGGRVLAERDLDRAFRFTLEVPAAVVAADETAITIESSAWYVPAERNWRPSGDQRRLAVKVHDVHLTGETSGSMPAR